MDLAQALSDLFIERSDVKSWQHSNGSYTPDRTPITKADIEAHLAGTRTMGHYLTSPENHCKLFAYDIDLTVCQAGCLPKCTGACGKPRPREEFAKTDSPHRRSLLRDLAIIAEGLARRTNSLYPDLHIAMAFSGSKGVHVYGFTGSEDAEAVKSGAVDILKSFGCFEQSKGKNFWRHAFGEYPTIEVETYPKQENLDGKELGNLMRLPLGINLKSGKPGMFVKVIQHPDDHEPFFKKVEPEEALSGNSVPWED